MAEFRLGLADFAHVVERRRIYMLRRSTPFPLVSLLAAGVLWIVAAPAALVVLGMALAWGITICLEWFAIRRDLQSHFAWGTESVSMQFDESGIHVTNADGAGFMRWGAIWVTRYPDGFIVSDDAEELYVLPKRHLSTTELLFLKQHEVARNDDGRLGRARPERTRTRR
jgi:hypothetical protein